MARLEYDDNGKTISVEICFTERRKVGGKADLLLRALGKKRTSHDGGRPLVVDATAGLCRDSMHILALGFSVIAIEKNEKIFNALNELRPPEGLTLLNGDAIEWMLNLKESERPDIVFLDPMFPEKKKSAAVAKESRLLQTLVAAPSEFEERELLKAAIKAARDRVVVKRPRNAPWLANDRPAHEFRGKSVRYDLYITSGASSKRLSPSLTTTSNT